MPAEFPAFAAVDLGASSGRVVLGRVGPGHLELDEVHRFVNRPVTVAGTLQWDVGELYAQTLAGLGLAAERAELTSIGIDSWAVDYSLLDSSGELLGNPVHYRDRRTDGVLDQVLSMVSARELYDITGIQQLQINTLVQLVASQRDPATSPARTLLLIPDLFGYWLTGAVGAEFTNASTTQLLDVRTGGWATQLISRLGLDPAMLPALRAPGESLGAVRPDVATQLGLDRSVPVIAVGSHDTASAVVGVPASTDRFAYISCGTWSLVGVELDEPVLTEASRQANFTNEGGVDGTVRYLRNVMGLWLLQECERSWRAEGWTGSLAELLDEAGRLPAFDAVIAVDDACFLAPGAMPRRIADYCTSTGQQPPSTRAEFTRCILDSLALAYRRTVRAALELSGLAADVVHVVGGGSQNALLCQLTADACGLPVLAGPTEAAALGNILVQARAAGVLAGGLDVLRALIVQTHELRRYEPSRDAASWREAEQRLAGLAVPAG
jgi:rhamnulokinase